MLLQSCAWEGPGRVYLCEAKVPRAGNHPHRAGVVGDHLPYCRYLRLRVLADHGRNARQEVLKVARLGASSQLLLVVHNINHLLRRGQSYMCATLAFALSTTAGNFVHTGYRQETGLKQRL